MKKTATFLFFALIFLTPTHAAEVNAIGEYCSGPCAYLKGEIKQGDLVKLKSIFEFPAGRRIFIPDFKAP